MGVLSIKGTDSDCDSKSCSLFVRLIVPTKSNGWWAVPTLQQSLEFISKEGKMVFETRRLFGAALILSVFFHMHIGTRGFASPLAKIAFTSVIEENSDIYVMNIDGGNLVRLTIDPARDYDPSWSPDGERITFVSNRERGIEQIYVMDSDGGNPMRLTNDSTHQEPAWSPNGDKIAYVRNRGGRQVWIMDVDGGNQTQLTEVGKNRQPAWSPDGKRIAFVSTRNRGNGLYVMEENGSNQERLTPDMNFTANPTWSPDGNWIAFGALDEVHTFQIYAARVAGRLRIEGLTRDLPHKLQPAWSPDGTTIAYSSWVIPFDRKRIHLMSSDGEHLKQLSERRDDHYTDPDWFDPEVWSVSPAANFVTIWGKIKTPTTGR